MKGKMIVQDRSFLSDILHRWVNHHPHARLLGYTLSNARLLVISHEEAFIKGEGPGPVHVRSNVLNNIFKMNQLPF